MVSGVGWRREEGRSVATDKGETEKTQVWAAQSMIRLFFDGETRPYGGHQRGTGTGFQGVSIYSFCLQGKGNYKKRVRGFVSKYFDA